MMAASRHADAGDRGMATDVGQLCDHVATTLYDEPVDHEALTEAAGLLLVVCSRVRRVVGELETMHGPTKRVWAAAVAVTACERHLWLVQQSRREVPDETLVRTVDRVLHLLTLTLRVLEAAGVSTRGPAA